MNMNIVRDQNLSTEEQALPREIELTDADLEAVHGAQGGALAGSLLGGLLGGALGSSQGGLLNNKGDALGEGVGDVGNGLLGKQGLLKGALSS